MARISNITFDQVAAAANAIKAAGDKPTARRVREALGTGSMATVLKHFQRWQGGGGNVDQGDVDEQQEITLDPAIVKAISTAIAAQVAAASAESASRIAELQGEIAALIQENERLTTENEIIDAELKDKTDTNATMTGKLYGKTDENRRLIDDLQVERKAREAADVSAEVAKARLAATDEIRQSLADKLDNLSDELKRSHLEAAELRGMLAAGKKKMENVAELAKPVAKKPRPSRAKPKAAPSPTSV